MTPFWSKSIALLSAYNHQNSMTPNGEEPATEGTRSARWMALDVGDKRIGVAVSDPLRLTARPLTTLARTRDGAEYRQLIDLLQRWAVERLVVGVPRRLSGETTASTQLVESFIAEFEGISGVRVERAEERLSSKEAERLMAEMRIPAEQRRSKRDAFAAALILEWYLEENSGTQK